MRLVYDYFKFPENLPRSVTKHVEQIYSPFFTSGLAPLGVPGPLRVTALFVTPDGVVLGLKAWRDVFEFETDPEAVMIERMAEWEEKRALFDQAEKIVPPKPKKPERVGASYTTVFGYELTIPHYSSIDECADEVDKTRPRPLPSWVTGKVLCVAYDIEKMLRMYLHGSTTIYDFLVISNNCTEDFPYYTDYAPKILTAVTNERHLFALLNESLIRRLPSQDSYDDVYELYEVPEDDGTESWACVYLEKLRRTLQAAALTENKWTVDLRELVPDTTWGTDVTGREILEMLDGESLVEKALETIRERPKYCVEAPGQALGPVPPDFEMVDYWLVRSRCKHFLA